MTKNKTRQNTPKPLPALLVGGFATSVENRLAEINNYLAIEGRLTDDPLAVLLRGLRRDLKESGFTFERVAQGQPVAQTPRSQGTRSQGARQGSRSQGQGARKAASKAAAPEVTVTSREITEDEIASLQLAGSISDVAPYGTDSEGLALAPYGIKKNGAPMLRRGRRAEGTKETTPQEAPAPVTNLAPAPVLPPVAEVSPVTVPTVPAVTTPSMAIPTPEAATSEDTDDLDALLEGFE